GPVVVPELLRALEELLHVRRIRRTAALDRIPAPDELRTRLVVLRVQLPRVEAIPPLTLAVGSGQRPVVRNADQRSLLVRALCGFVPRPRSRAVNAHAKAQPVVPRGSRPGADQVLLRADRDRIPLLISRVEIVEVVVMVGQSHEVLC